MSISMFYVLELQAFVPSRWFGIPVDTRRPVAFGCLIINFFYFLKFLIFSLMIELAFVVIPSILLAIVSSVHVEVNDAGDAGIANAQLTSLNSPSDSITGSVGTADADLFSFCVTDPSTFSATTDGTPGGLADTQLFVFNSLGQGIAFNDDIDTNNGVFRSRISSDTFIANGGVAGVNYIAIAAFGPDPVDSSDVFIFPDDFEGEHGPVDPNAVLSGFAGNSEAGGTYTIALTGVGAVSSDRRWRSSSCRRVWYQV
jgi:hypothetical protein